MVEPTNGTDGLSQQAYGEAQAALHELRDLEEGIILARAQFARQVGLTFNNARDLYKVLGYDRQLTTQQYRERYARGGIAGSAIDAYPDATWRGSMELVEDEDPKKDTEFEKAWKAFDTAHQVQAKFRRVDKLAGLSTYAVLLIGASGAMDTELPKSEGKGKGVLYLRPLLGGGGPNNRQGTALAADADATIREYDLDSKSERFGKPKFYSLRMVGIAAPDMNVAIHWTRVHHIAEGCLEDDIFGLPRLERIWNLLDDLDKVIGGGAEAFWLRANQGLHLDVDKDMELKTATGSSDITTVLASLKEQSELYKHQIDRWIRTKGVKVNTLGSDVADFTGPADAIVTQISGALRIPKRILTGSEMGELASSQDRDNWKDQINGRQEGYAGPYIVRPLVDRLIAYGYLPAPAKGPSEYKVMWPHIQTLTEQEKVAGATGWATVNKTQGAVVFTDDEIRDKWAGYEPLPPEKKVPLTSPERVSANAPTPPDDVVGGKGVPAAAAPGAAVVPGAGKFPRAAEQAEDAELIRVLAAAIECGNREVVDQIIGLRKVAPDA
jgi:hypothetical protein